MSISSGQLTVYFEDPFWVGVFEVTEDGKLSVCKVTFGAEPKDYEVLDFILKNYYRLKFSPAVDAAAEKEIRNPKRMQREIRKRSASTGIGTKSQQALQLQREEHKLERIVIRREQKEAEKQRHYELKQQKRKKEHQGR